MIIDMRPAHPMPIKSNVIILQEPTLVVPDEPSGILTPGGIFIPSKVVEHTEKNVAHGIVMSIGPLVNEVVEGDSVLFNKHATKEIEHEGQTYLSISVFEIFAVV